jgi:hypothetical protein
VRLVCAPSHPLQLRFLELYDAVDLFVLYEIPYTHMGMEKALYFNNSLAGTLRSCEPRCLALDARQHPRHCFSWIFPVLWAHLFVASSSSHLWYLVCVVLRGL